MLAVQAREEVKPKLESARNCWELIPAGPAQARSMPGVRMARRRALLRSSLASGVAHGT